MDQADHLPMPSLWQAVINTLLPDIDKIMGRDPEYDIKVLVWVAIATLVAIFIFWYLLYGELPFADLISGNPAGNGTVPGNGTPLDPLLEKVAGVETYFTSTGMAMINGSYWKG